MVCEICKLDFKNFHALSLHIVQIHKIKTKEYYDRFLKCSNEGICYCGKGTSYISLSKGYRRFCSTKCQSNDHEILLKRKVSGDDHWTKKKGGPNKGKTYEEIHGKKKAKELKTNLSIMGKKLVKEKNPFYGKTHNYENREKFRKNRLGKTYEEIYGYEKSKEIKKKLMKENLTESGWRDYWSEYPLKFQDKNLRIRILRSQNYKCPICFKDIRKKYSKNLHHINYIKKDNRRKNLIYLCISCHIRTNTIRDEWKVYLRKINRKIIKFDKLPRGLMLKIDKEQSLKIREKINISRRRIHYG